jgi:hypothetical protein
MSCSLTYVDVATFSAVTGASVTITLKSPLGGAKMAGAVATPATGDQVTYQIAGDSFTLQMLAGLTTLVITFVLSGVFESALLVEDCGGDPAANTQLGVVQTGNSSGYAHTLTMIGT